MADCFRRRHGEVGHYKLHSSNTVHLRAPTTLNAREERQAGDFAYGLLVDEVEALAQGLTKAWEFAEYFGVTKVKVQFQGRLI